MNKKRALFVAASGTLLLPAVASAQSTGIGMGCVPVSVAVGLAMLPPEAITDAAQTYLPKNEGNQ